MGLIKKAKKAVKSANNRTHMNNAVYAQQLGGAASKAAFKKKHWMTPSQYIKKHQK